MRRTDGDDEVSEDTGHPDQTVLGIDLGVNSLAVSSTGTFWQGDDYDHWCREFEKRRGEMQHRGTQAAHKALLRLGKREEAWRKQYIHTIANELVSEAIEHDCDVIAFEDLSDIREGFRKLNGTTSGRSDACLSMSRTKPLNRVSPWNRSSRTTRPNVVLGQTVGLRTRTTARRTL